MLSFLRKIRKQLLAENKFTRYLIYAIGEIILIVIGIMIALTINNSNQHRIIREKEQTYLAGLQNEFLTSKYKLQELIKVNRSNYEGAMQILAYISDKDATPDEKQFSTLLYNTFAFDIAYNPNISLLNEMINSGSLKDLENAELRIRLTTWVSTVQDITKQELELGIQREKVLDMFRTDDYSIKTILEHTGFLNDESGGKYHSNLMLLNSRAFENNVLMFMVTTHFTETTHYLPLMEELDSILALIDEEIKH